MHDIIAFVRSGILYEFNHEISLVLNVVERTSVEDADFARYDSTGRVIPTVDGYSITIERHSSCGLRFGDFVPIADLCEDIVCLMKEAAQRCLACMSGLWTREGSSLGLFLPIMNESIELASKSEFRVIIKWSRHGGLCV